METLCLAGAASDSANRLSIHSDFAPWPIQHRNAGSDTEWGLVTFAVYPWAVSADRRDNLRPACISPEAPSWLIGCPPSCWR